MYVVLQQVVSSPLCRNQHYVYTFVVCGTDRTGMIRHGGTYFIYVSLLACRSASIFCHMQTLLLFYFRRRKVLTIATRWSTTTVTMHLQVLKWSWCTCYLLYTYMYMYVYSYTTIWVHFGYKDVLYIYVDYYPGHAFPWSVIFFAFHPST